MRGDRRRSNYSGRLSFKDGRFDGGRASRPYGDESPSGRRLHTAHRLGLKEDILSIYAASHAELIDLPWWSPGEFWDRLDEIYAKTADFGLVAGWAGAEMIGYAFGSPSDRAETQADVHRIFPHLEPAGSVYLFREFAVRPEFQRHGFGTRIHDELLRNRPEKAALLLVRQDNVPARAAYARWAWVKAGEKKPFPDSPELDILTLDLESRRSDPVPR
jgi:ribosomal protein S18 acetylase RimI-like enzyme